MHRWIDWLNSASRPGLRPTVGLVLTGGGSRSAYQVGVLLALAEFLPRARNPFQVIVGTSAGAVAASVLAAEAHQWRRAIAGLERVWANFRSSQVFHVDTGHMLRAGAHWVLSLLSGGLVLAPPKSMLDNSPLRELLSVHVDCAGIRRSIARGHLRAFALCATSYATGHSVVLLRRRRFHPGLVARAARRPAHRTVARSPDGERGDPAVVSADAAGR